MFFQRWKNLLLLLLKSTFCSIFFFPSWNLSSHISVISTVSSNVTLYSGQSCYVKCSSSPFSHHSIYSLLVCSCPQTWTPVKGYKWKLSQDVEQGGKGERWSPVSQHCLSPDFLTADSTPPSDVLQISGAGQVTCASRQRRVLLTCIMSDSFLDPRCFCRHLASTAKISNCYFIQDSSLYQLSLYTQK